MQEGLSRRRFLAGSAAVAVAGVAGVALRPDKLLQRPRTAASLRPYCMAMHVHACFSEGPGSMEAQLTQAAKSGVDVVWWTEHDQRMAAHGYREWVHFDGLTERESDLGWSWIPDTKGKPIETRSDFVTDVSSTRDPGGPGSLLLRVRSGGTYARHELLGKAEQDTYRTSLDGQTLEIDVRPVSVSDTALIAVEVTTSFRPARNGRPADTYVLSYRVGGGRLPGSMVAREALGIVTLDAPRDTWTTLRLTPAKDLSAIWPGIDGRDAALFELRLVAICQRGEAAGYFDGLRFIRTRNSGQTPLRTQAELARSYEAQYPTVRQIQGLELSLTTPHIGWYGGKVALPDHRGAGPSATLDPDDAAKAVRTIHQAGGLASYNHPFGTTSGALDDRAQDKARKLKAAELVDNRAMGCDLIEVGYRVRGGCNLDRHLSIWDNCSRNAIFLTGTGVSDDHKGKDWERQQLNFVTWAWAASEGAPDLVQALGAGRAYFGDPAHFRGRLDLIVDGKVPMGAVSVSDAGERDLTIILDGLPDGGTVQVVRGDVDLAGADEVDPVLETSELSADDFDSEGSAKVSVDTSTPRFVRVVVSAADGLPVAFSNPIWLLRSEPPRGTPRARRA